MSEGNILITGTRKGIGNQLANYYLKKNPISIFPFSTLSEP